MPRIRTVKPEFWSDEDMSSVSEAAALLAIALLNFADDEGYFVANPALIKAFAFPLRETGNPITELVDELVSIGYVQMGMNETGKRIGHIVHFSEHQVVNRRTPSKLASQTIVWDGQEEGNGWLTESSLTAQGALTEDLMNGNGALIRERKGKEGNYLRREVTLDDSEISSVTHMREDGDDTATRPATDDPDDIPWGVQPIQPAA